MYWEVDASAFGAYEVDWVRDGSTLFATNYSDNPLTGGHVGEAPLLGISEPGANLAPVLSLLGEPRIALDAVFQIEQGPPKGTMALNLGSPTDLPGQSGCRILVTPDLSWGPATLDDLGVGRLTVLGSGLTAPVLLRADFHWQAVVLPVGGGSVSLSNGLITRFGGLYP